MTAMTPLRGLALLLAWLAVLASAASGQPSPARGAFAELDRYVRATPAEQTVSLLHLARYLNARAHSESEKARALYVWVTHNVAYDVEAYRSGRLRSTNLEADEVLQSRVTVCDGYSRLMEDLGNLMGLVVVRVEGYAQLGRGSRYGDGSANHAWSAVRIDRRWYLLDATWGAGYIDSRTMTFVRRFDEAYFLAAPERLIATHYPSDPKWQLLDPPIPVRVYLQKLATGSPFTQER